MKVRIDIDCTPEEARAFFGLPDVAPMQAALMAQLQERLSASLAAADPEAMLRTWLPMGMQNFEKMQEMFWGGMGRGGRSGDKPKGG
jgi:hypothetical protein